MAHQEHQEHQEDQEKTQALSAQQLAEAQTAATSAVPATATPAEPEGASFSAAEAAGAEPLPEGRSFSTDRAPAPEGSPEPRSFSTGRTGGPEPPLKDQLPESAVYAGKRVARQRERDSFGFTFLCVNLGLILTALGVDLFKAPNHFALGGTSGLSIILATLFPTFNVGAFMWILNGVLVALGLVFLGRKTMGWTIFASFALSFYVSLFEWIWPVVTPFTSNKLLELCFAVLLPALGSALVFNVGASTGGTDILAMILKKKTTLQIGRALFVVDGLIVVWSVFLYGAETGLLCILGLLAKTMVVDGAIEGVNQSKVCTLICRDPGQVERFLVQELHRTATLTRVEGGFSGEPYTQVMCVLSRSEAVRLRNWVRQTQPGVFMTLVTTSEIVGRGFRGAN